MLGALALAAIAAAEAVPKVAVPSEMPAPSTTVGGKTTVLNDPRWLSCANIDALEYRDETVSCHTLMHDTPLYRISVRNRLPVPRTIEVTVSAPRAAHSAKTVALGPKAAATVTIPSVFASETGYDGNYSAATLCERNPPDGGQPKRDQVLLSQEVAGYHYGYYSRKTSDGLNLLLSRGIVRDAVIPSFKHDFNTVELRRDAADWPRDFRAYLQFDAVCLAPDVAKALPDETRAALRVFKLLGGSVLEFDGAAVPARLQASADAAQTRRIGDLAIRTYYSGKTPSLDEHYERVPIKIAKSLPIGMLVALLAVVAFGVMPGLVFLCAKRNRRLLVLAALPGTAFALTLVVALIALLAYGTTPTVRVQSITLLDPESRLAVTRGQFAVFAPGNVANEMSIPADVAFRLRGRGDSPSMSAAFGESCRLSGDWIKPLSATFFDFDRAERRSERLDVKPADGGRISVANLLGVPITGGIVQRGDFRYMVPPLAPGEQATIGGKPFSTKGSPPLHETFFGSKTNFGRHWGNASDLLKEAILIPDGTYAVQLDGSPFFPSPLAGHKAYETSVSIVCGAYAADGGKEASK